MFCRLMSQLADGNIQSIVGMLAFVMFYIWCSYFLFAINDRAKIGILHLLRFGHNFECIVVPAGYSQSRMCTELPRCVLALTVVVQYQRHRNMYVFVVTLGNCFLFVTGRWMLAFGMLAHPSDSWAFCCFKTCCKTNVL